MDSCQFDGVFILCPICHGKTRTMVSADTILLNFPLFCPKCKAMSIVDIRDFQMTVIQTAKE